MHNVPKGSTTVRFGEDLWTLLEREATRDGLSAAQYVRDAAVMRLAFALAEQGDARSQATLADVATRSLGRRAQDPPDPVLANPTRRAALVRTGLLSGPIDQALDRL